MRKLPLVLALSAALALIAACGSQTPPAPQAGEPSAGAAPVEAAGNPLFAEWTTPFAAIPFDQIRLEHIGPALDRAMQEQLEAVAAIVASSEAPTPGNTLEPLERSSAALRRAGAVYSVFAGNLSNEEVRKLETEYAPKLAAHQNRILLDPGLFARVKAIHESAETASAGAETARLAEQTYRRFVRAGAALDEEARAKVAALTQREAELMTRFNQNLLKDTDAFTLVLEESDLDGLPESLRQSAGQSASDRGQAGKFVFTLQRPDYESFMTFSTRRDLRERYFHAFINRGNNDNEFDNKATIAELVRLRVERAELLGFPSHAALVTADSMAQTPRAALDLLERVWTPALAQAGRDRADLEKLIRESGQDHPLEGWDWRFYAEKLRAERYAMDAAELAPYLGLENMLAASFAVSERLFGLRFSERKDIPVYHPDVRVFEVTGQNDVHVGLFYIDYFARQGKRSGAWMANFRPQNRLDGEVTAQVVNNLNVPKPPAGQPALISLTEATTLFHELGHALHGLLSDVRYPSLSGTAVPRDYVEFPAQFMEHYVTQPSVLKEFARHVETGEPIPDALIERLLASRQFNQSFATVEFVASALVDQRYHALTREQAADLDPAAFEREVLAELGAIEQIPMRHRSTQFSHIFGGGYAAAYYAYMWSEVLDADGFAAFEESGDIFDPETAGRLLRYVYSRGNTIDWMEGYRSFRGREPSVEPLLKGRGLLSDES